MTDERPIPKIPKDSYKAWLDTYTLAPKARTIYVPTALEGRRR